MYACRTSGMKHPVLLLLLQWMLASSEAALKFRIRLRTCSPVLIGFRRREHWYVQYRTVRTSSPFLTSVFSGCKCASQPSREPRLLQYEYCTSKTRCACNPSSIYFMKSKCAKTMPISRFLHEGHEIAQLSHGVLTIPLSSEQSRHDARVVGILEQKPHVMAVALSFHTPSCMQNWPLLLQHLGVRTSLHEITLYMSPRTSPAEMALLLGTLRSNTNIRDFSLFSRFGRKKVHVPVSGTGIFS